VGSSYKDTDADEAITDINVTPFVDVVLVLLVVFMVTAKLIVARGVEIDKPKAATGGEVHSTMRVTVDEKGVIKINGAAFASDNDAVAKIKELAAASDKPKAIVTGARTGAYGNVMRAIDLVKQAGDIPIALENRPLDSP
jgi:biopolymer transport protein ExbD